MELVNSFPHVPSRPPGERGSEADQEGPSAAEVDANVQRAIHLSSLARTLPSPVREGRTAQDVADENEEISKLIAQLRRAQQTTADLIARVKEHGTGRTRPVYTRNFCPSDEGLASIQKMIQANEREEAQLEKTLKQISDPRYMAQLTTQLQKLDSAITRLTRENRRKEGKNKRVGQVLEGEEKGAESFATRLHRELDHLSHEVSSKS
ncbi:hypothetical protein BESB_063510 [Besnoitia besnoiti]|uniref:Uncharacterized protein n=1 Tax=Besnoitia besnoiti TaxID=94643 RepID=A0A2A9ME42_BESBE|nr:hypothetical protein BESB_063510 [Besnoitia besnoiti]PFH35464.1 hypothetical protein BESB_063510 [Besnoitia besnoiti]